MLGGGSPMEMIIVCYGQGVEGPDEEVVVVATVLEVMYNS